MNDFINKIRLIFLPFLSLSIIVVLLYTLLHWLFIIKFELINIDEGIVKVWVPMAIPWIPIFLFLRPRILLLNVENKRGDDRIRMLYYMIAGFSIVAPLLIAQEYLITATGKLTTLKSVNEIGSQQKSKYYTISDYYIDKHHAGAEGEINVTGKHNETINFAIYIACPMLATTLDTSRSVFNSWYGVLYKEHFHNPKDQVVAEGMWKNFWQKSITDFWQKDICHFEYLDRIGNNTERRGFEMASKKTGHSLSDKELCILCPVYTPFNERNGTKFPWIFGSFAIGSILFLIFIAVPAFKEERFSAFTKHKPVPDTDMKEMLTLFIPREGFFVTPILIDTNIFIFIIMVISGLGFITLDAQKLLIWGANFRPMIINGQWWRLLSSVFLHGGVMHLVMNMYGLLFVGMFLEPILGKTKFFVTYLFTGLLASIASIYCHSATISVGASGAIFGMYGIFLSLLTTKLFPASFRASFLLSTSVFIGYNLLMGLAGGIDNAAHIGGLLSGIIIGFIIYPIVMKEQRNT